MPEKEIKSRTLKGKYKKPAPRSVNSLPSDLSRPRGPRTGFYDKVLDEAEKLDFELAAGVDGINDEIALLRVKIKSRLEQDPNNLKNILQATNTLAKLVKVRYSITPEQKNGLKEAIANVIKDVAVPLGITVINKNL
jgi:hypothetical protein